MIQQDHLQVFDLTLTVLAPLFIGSGNKYTKKEYMYNERNGKVSFFDDQKFFNFLVERGLVEKYSRFMLGQDTDDLRVFLTKTCGIPNAELKDLKRYEILVGDALNASRSRKEIYAFQRDAYGRAYIPGSSVKGALRTAWLLDAVLKDTDTSTGHTLAPGKDSTFPEEKYVDLLHLNRGKKTDAVNSIFRGVQVADSGPISDKCMVLADKFDVNTLGVFSKPPLCRECVAPGTSIRLRLTLDQSVLKGRITQESLQNAIRQYDACYQQTYCSKFTPPVGSVSLPQQPYLILGGGAGFFSKSLAYPYLGEQEALRWTVDQLSLSKELQKHQHKNDIDVGISPRTMKYARFKGKFYPYGYCGVRIE